MDVRSWLVRIALDCGGVLIFSFIRTLKGVMAGYDQKSNVVLSDSKERVYSPDEGVEEIPLGLYLVKGDQMYVRLLFILNMKLTMSIGLISKEF